LGLEVLELFGLATWQSHPTYGLRKYGVPVGGAFDQESHGLANALVGASERQETIELSMASLRLRADGPCTLAVVGGASVEVDGKALGSNLAFSVGAGQLVAIGPSAPGSPAPGARAYLAAVGLERSGRVGRVANGDLLKVSRYEPSVRKLARPPESLGAHMVRVVEGPQGDLLGGAVLGELLATGHVVTPHGDRTGIRLAAQESLRHGVELTSEPASLGAIQVTPGGVPIVLGPDGPTIGGYPKVAVVCSADLDRVGQWRPGDTVCLCLVSPGEARTAARQRTTRLERLQRELRVRF